MPLSRWPALAVLLLTAALAAADPHPARYFDPPKQPADARLKGLADLDHPAPFSPHFADKAAWERRAHRLREQVLVANGLWPMPEKPPLQPVIHGKIDRDEYTIEKVYFASLPGHYVCGNLYRPKNRLGKNAAVLCPHGHWANGRLYENSDANARKEIAAGAEKTLEGAKYPLQARCAMLARMGCVVFFYDMVGYADSTFIPHMAGFADAAAELRLQSAMGLQTWNSIRALDFVAGLPDVDPKRIAVTGASGGGTQTFLLGVVDERPAVTVPAVMVSMNMQGGCICENCSLLRTGTNNVELAALFAPKPQFLTAADDWTKDVESRGLPELKTIYGLYGAADKVGAKYNPFPHNYNQVSRELMYNWLNQHLHLGQPEPVTEKPFVPVPPKDLRVFDDGHPRPKDATDAAGVRKWLTETSDRQLDALAKNADEYRRVVRAALRAMVADEVPEKVAPVAGSYRESKGDGYAIHQALLARPGSGEQIPAVGLIPEGWDKTITIWVAPQGKAGAFDAAGKPIAAVRQLLAQKSAVLTADLFLTGEYHLPGQPTKPLTLAQVHHKQIPFAGYQYGYNRTLLAERVHDLLTVIAMAKELGATQVDLVAEGDAGLVGLLACALAGDRIRSATIDLNHFDFDQVKDTADAHFLPGAVKYGGVFGIAPACGCGKTMLFNPPPGGRRERLALTPAVELLEKAR